MKTDTLEVLMELKDVLRRTCLNEEALIFLIKSDVPSASFCNSFSFFLRLYFPFSVFNYPFFTIFSFI